MLFAGTNLAACASVFEEALYFHPDSSSQASLHKAMFDCNRVLGLPGPVSQQHGRTEPSDSIPCVVAKGTNHPSSKESDIVGYLMFLWFPIPRGASSD